MRKARSWVLGGLLSLVALILSLWWARALILSQAAKAYFQSHGVTAEISLFHVGFSGVSGRFALGPKNAPDLAAERIDLRFDPLRWTPYVTEVRLIRPSIRAQIAPDGRITLGSLQDWLSSLGGGTGGPQFVSPDLSVSLSGLRLLAATPAGFMEWDGDVRLLKNVPLSAHLRARPATLSWKGATLSLRSANLDYQGPQASIRIVGDFHYRGFALDDMTAEADAAGLAIGRGSIEAQSARFLVSGEAGRAPVRLSIAAQNVMASGQESHGDLRVRAEGGYPADFAQLTAIDAPLARALQDNLAHLNLDFAAHAETKGRNIAAQLTAPLTIEGAKGAMLQVPALHVAASPGEWRGDFALALEGPGLPALKAKVQKLAWQHGTLSAHTQFDTSFDYGSFKGVRIGAEGGVSWASGRYGFEPKDCARFSLKAFRTNARVLARNVSARLCGQGKVLISGEGQDWRLTARAKEASAFLPVASSALDGIGGTLSFEGKGSQFAGHVALQTARLSDRAPSLRFNPLSARGVLDYGNGIWRGSFKLASGKGVPLGDVVFTHAMARGTGRAHIAAGHLAFAPQTFQPSDLSPLLATFRNAQGSVRFTGDLDWTPKTIASRGVLNVDGLEFVTPLGRAHDLKTQIAFSSLLPPKTAGTISLSIARIDWALPIANVAMRFSLDPAAVHVEALSADWAQGRVSLEPFQVKLAAPSEISGIADLKKISLDSLVAVSNLGSKLKVSGTVSGRVPFAAGAKGVRIEKGTISADGPGRLSVDRSLWMQGDAAISSNAVQDFAYQALENLAFDSLRADLNSVSGGRLQILFHIKGKSAPPKPQTANVSILDILNGTALYKPIPLPSGTPIDLTLDTSLNFDELLQSYSKAWSEVLSPNAK